jgi:hypothetical protein
MARLEPIDSPEPPVPESASEAPPRPPDGLDRLISFFGHLERSLGWIVLAALGAWIWYLGAICATTALLRRSVAAQTFFINLLADMGWSGYSILFIIGAGLVSASLLQLLFWPRGWPWRWLRSQFGWPAAYAATLVWASIGIGKSLLLGWGFEQWAFPWFIETSASLGVPPTPTGLLVLCIIVAPVLALFPEWSARVAFSRLRTAWRMPGKPLTAHHSGHG